MAGRRAALACSLVLMTGALALASCPSFGTTSATLHTLHPSLVALTCPTPESEVFAGDERVRVSQCFGGQWTVVDDACAADSKGAIGECPPATPPANSISNKDFSDSNGVFASYYECTEGQVWLSGMPGQVSQCIAGNWTQVLDVCTEDCLVPRDCSEILQLGMNETGVYRIIPSGDSHGTSVEAWCDMDADGYDPSGGGWTTVLRRNPSESSFAGETLDWHRAAQLFPDRSAADNDFFIGLDNLVQLNRYPNGTVRPLVFQFLLEVSGEPLFHASYDSVVVGEAPGFTLLEVGRFHGNAGDCFSQHVGYNFTGDDEFWWLPEDGANYMSFLTKDAGEWKTLKDHGKTPEGLTLRVRPRDFDQAVSCPAMDVMDEDWMGAGEFTWEGEVTLGRLPGHVIEYTCQGEMMAAGAGGSAGVVGCEVDAGGGLTPSWNSTFEPPCVFTCPDDFVNSRNTTCYHFSTSAAEKGIVEAARRCGTLGATLAAVSDEADLAGATAPAFYFTGHTLSSLDVATPDLSFLECADSCSASPSSDCVVVNASARAAHDCEASDAHFVCQVPAYCPAGYSVFRGMCYKLVTASDHKEALVACNAESAALAYPEEPDVLFFLSALFRESISVTSPKWVMVGLNDAWGNWSGGGLYSPSAELISQALTSDSEHWRVITIPVAEDQLPHFTPFTIRTGATKAFCQFPGPVGCWIEPLEPTANMTRSWDNSSAISTEITYTCNYGYFVDGNTSLTEQTVECLGQLGGWYPPTIADCYRVEVCLEVPSPPSSAIANVSDSESLFLGGSVNFTCPPTMATAAAASLQVLTCTESSGAFGFQPQQVEPCTVCAAEPEVLNASTTWVNTSTWQLDSTITATCDADHLVAIGETSFTITCNETGWQHEAACYEGCVDEPPAPGDNMTRDAVEWAGVGVVLHYNCSPGYYIPPTEAGEAPLTRTKVTCLANHTWTPEGPDLNCSRVCLGSPPSVDPPANSSWDGVTSVVGTQFELSCPPDYFFGDLNSSVAVECGDDEQWTAVDPELLHCRRVCNSSLPPEPANAALVAEEPPYWEGASATYVCPQGMLSKAGQTSASVECASEGWTQLDPDFACFNSCLSLPPEGPARVSSNYTGGRVEGTAVEYTCLAGFYDPGSATPPTSVTSVCEGGSWSLETLPYCGDPSVPTSSTTTEPPITYPSHVSIQELLYEATTDMHVGSLEQYMTGANGEDPDTFEKTDGPFGFGYAIRIQSENEECLVKENYDSQGDCTKDPNLCSKGFSISIWEKADFSYDIFWTINNLESEPKRYVLSTGGDDEGHPGIAIYHQGISLVAIVSTGDEYWKLEVYGPFHNSTWNNIGILWSKPVGTNGGLEMHVNHRRVGSVFKGISATRKSALSPPELMIGCHKDNDNQLYRGYNDAEFDELAMWKRSLPDNETMYFLGGYEGEMSFIDPEEYQIMLERTDLKDPSQLATAFSVLSRMDVSSWPENITDEEAVNSTLRLQNAMSTLTNPENIPKSITDEQWITFLDIIHATSNLLDEETENTWLITEAKGKPGATEVARDFEGFYLDLLDKVSMNGRTNLDYTKTSENIAARCHKKRIRDLMSASSYVTPDYSQMMSLYSDWDRPLDKAFVPTDIFTDDRCLERSVSILTVLYDSLDDVAHDKVSTSTIRPSMPNYLDSRVMSVRMRGVPELDEQGLLIPSSPLCYPDPDSLRQTPIKVVLEHKIKERALRRILFHDEEPEIKINYRHCVRWNDRAQMWDGSGCIVEYTTATYTRCSCKGFGSFAIMAEELEPIVAPVIPDMMLIIIQAGYIASMVCLIFYMLVVGFTGDLKDQHHLVGFNLAGCLLFGDLMVLLTYFLPIPEDRHNCAFVGSLIHGFFLAAGGWVAMMGHTAFKTITAGVIGGKLRAYLFLSWGITVTSIGVTYLVFMRHLGTDPRCFISWTNEVKGVFFVPQLGFCSAAVFFVCIVFFNLHSATLRNADVLADYKAFCIGASILALYFSTTWAIGCAALIRWDAAVPNLYPIYEILNCFTGLVLLFTIGFGSRRFRLSLSGHYKKKRQMLNNYRNKNEETQQLGSPEDQRRPISAASTVVAE